MKPNNDKMRPKKDLEVELEQCRSLYDSLDNNPYKQSLVAHRITKILYQIKLWDDFKNSVN